jgi:DNA-binding transcriptional MerR regulator
LFQVNTSLIRFWEKEFTILKPKKNKKGNRMFTVKDIANIERIFILVKEQGFTLDGAKRAMKSGVEADQSVEEISIESNMNTTVVVNKLEEIKRKLLALKQ